MTPNEVIGMNDMAFFRNAISKFGKSEYRKIKEKHAFWLQRLEPGKCYQISRVPEEERLLFIKHCCFQGRVDADYVLLLSNEFVVRRTPQGNIVYPDA